MKYLDNISLERMSNFINGKEMGDRILMGRIESFSCKRAGEDKKLSKVLEAKIVEDLAATPRNRTRSSSLGDLSSGSARRLLIDLISTMNASFPDYDFSSISPESFVLEDVTTVVQRVNSYLAEMTASNPTFLDELWNNLDEAVQVKKCEVYSYVPDMDGDPFSDGALWCFNYFFFNKELKRICYFTCVAKSIMRGKEIFDNEEDEDEYYDRLNQYDVDDEDLGDDMELDASEDRE